MAASDVVVIGAGVIGLAVADALLQQQPGLTVTVVDKEPRLAEHASGRNSGVLHAGFYYSPDSLKARFTKDGNQRLHAFCERHSIPVRRCGKVVVAQDASELPELHKLFDRGRSNGVELELIDEAGLKKLEPRARTTSQAIWSPTTSVADPKLVVQALAQQVRDRGGLVRLGLPVTAAAPGYVELAGKRLTTGHVVNAAGLYADRIANSFGWCDDYVMVPFKGLYWYSTRPSGWLQRLVYPVPDPRNPFLGVHLTVTTDGRTKVGPTAIPAARREDYARLPSFARGETSEIFGAYPVFVRSERHDVAGLLRSELPKYSRRYLVRQAARLVPGLDAADFTQRGRPGVRAQLMHKASGQLEMDFVVRGDADSTHILNTVSPGWTSSLAFAEHVARQILDR